MNLSSKKRIKFLVVTLLSAFATTLYQTEKTKNPAFIVTGFEPFHGDKSNPSWDAVQLLPDHIDHIKLVKLKLPVSYARSYFPLQKSIRQFLCNHVFYLLLHEINNQQIPAGFIHVPNITYYNVTQDKIALEESIKIILGNLLAHSNDLSENNPKRIRYFTL